MSLGQMRKALLRVWPTGFGFGIIFFRLFTSLSFYTRRIFGQPHSRQKGLSVGQEVLIVWLGNHMLLNIK
jgi:hypothetical protein